MKTDQSKSWVAHVKNLLHRYSLPSIPDLISKMPSRLKWKEVVKKAVENGVREDLKAEALTRTSLCNLNPTFTKTLHNATLHIRNPREVTRATIKCQMLTGTYKLQTLRLRFKQTTSDTCITCGEGSEDLKHMLLHCEPLEEVRRKYLSRIISILPYPTEHFCMETT